MGRITSTMLIGALALTACSGNDGDATTGTDTATSPASPTSDATTPETDPSDGTDDTGGSVTDPDDSTVADIGAAPSATPADAATMAAVEAAVEGAPAGCDPLDTRHCMLPFPSNAHRINGRVAFPADGMPVNVSGVAIDPAEWNRNDGFSPNTAILAHLPGLDPIASSLPSWTDLDASLADDATVVLVNTETGERVPLWAELDEKANDDSDRLLEIHPAVALDEGASYVVGLRGMRTDDGDLVEPSVTFRAYRDNLVTSIDSIEDRRPAMEATFGYLAAAGVARAELALAWDFTVATTADISDRMLHIRDETLAVLGDDAPAFTIESALPGEAGEGVAVQVLGTFTVANFLTGDGGPANRFFYGDADVGTDPDALPQQNGTVDAEFACNISDATMAGAEPAHLVQYGHGLLGSNLEIDAGNVRAFANEHNVVFCSTKWAGMSENDIGNAAATLAEFSNFPTMADRLQQGVLNQIVLGRLMIHPDGLVSDPSFRRSDGSLLIDAAHLDYDGNSQGGIMGLMLSAVSPDIERSVVGVVGMNYSTLLSRSVDFETYEAIMEPAYPDDLERVLILAMTQMLWDRGEGAGYVQHISDDTYPGTPPKDVLLHVAFGDWQVSELTAMIAAREIGATIHRPVASNGRSREVEPGWGLPTTQYPSDGSALVIWDSGSDPIPLGNIPPSTSRDPHEDPRADVDVRAQKAAFLFDDILVDVCSAAPCTTDARD